MILIFYIDLNMYFVSIVNDIQKKFQQGNYHINKLNN